MGEFQIVITAAIIIILVSTIIIIFRNKQKQAEQQRKRKTANRRMNYRVQVNIKNSVMEVLKIGSLAINEHDACEIVDVSVGGAGVISHQDFPLRQIIFVRVYFYLNDEMFSLNGRVVRKVERINKKSYFYGIQFLNLSSNEENQLIKHIAAIQKRRRKKLIK